jgi:Cu(I)/Ag(I) efflux system membrane protein CusA/SilA
MTIELPPDEPPSEPPPEEPPPEEQSRGISGAWHRFLGFFVDNKLIVVLLVLATVLTGIMVAPFRWEVGSLPSDPVPVDAIPDIGDNQQIIFTKWPGRSPRDVEDQVSYPLTTALLGIPGVRTVRSFSMFGFSSIYVIFEEDIEFYWSRSRILEKLASLPSGTLPPGVAPALGPDATALGQVFWYTLEGRDEHGQPAAGWSLEELRSIQDWTVRYALQGVSGVSEVASVGGHVKEYQIDLDPEALLAHHVNVAQVASAVRQANLDVGARTIEINQAEYIVRGLGFVRSVRDLEAVVVANREHTPIRIKDVAKVHLGPAQRRGALDYGGAQAVGGVVVARFGANPLEAIEAVKDKIAEISPGLPSRTLEDGTVSQVKVVPFYDRSELIHETLSTLSSALAQQILITIIVVLVMLRNLRTSLMISAMVPLGMLGAFIGMKFTGVDANIMALSGIAIAIGTMVDMGIVFSENIVAHLGRAHPGESRAAVVKRATAEVAPAVLTSTTTTIVSFLPIFGLTAAEGKLFRPLAFTKTFAMAAALLFSMLVLPAMAHWLLRPDSEAKSEGSAAAQIARVLFRREAWVDWALAAAGVAVAIKWHVLFGVVIVLLSAARLSQPFVPERHRKLPGLLSLIVAALAVTVVLADYWLPLGPGPGILANRLFVALAIGAVMGSFTLFLRFYPDMLRWALDHKWLTLAASLCIVVLGLFSWRGSKQLLSWMPDAIVHSAPAHALQSVFPGLGREYMPPLDEGAFLYMPTTMPHATIGVALGQLAEMDARIAAVPEVATAVGKLGRVDSPLDPAPVSMFETIVSYVPEYKLDASGRRIAYRLDGDDYARDDKGELIADPDGQPFRQWRPHIKSPRDIWKEIQTAAKMPGLTSAPELMPIAARIIMLQSGMRAPMGIKIRGPDLATIEKVGLEIEALLKKVPSVRAETVVADRIVGKPYIEIDIDRDAIARHGISVHHVQNVIQVAIGGRTLTRTVEGRERYPVRVRYMRERRDSIDAMKRILVPSPLGHQLPLEQLATIRYARGPQVIKSEDTFLTGYVVFDKLKEKAEVDVVEEAQAFLEAKIQSREFVLPAGVSYRFAGNYQNQLRADARLSVLFPTALLVIFLLIYFQFRSTATTLIIFSGVLLGIAGGFVLLWLYGKPWFLAFSPFDIDLQSLFQIHNVNISVAVWVGFIALVGIATDNGVVLATYLHQRFLGFDGTDVQEVRKRAHEAGVRRARPCLMATGTTVLALLPVITSTGRGADVMLPMALPSMGGMSVALITLFLVPVLYSVVEEKKARRRARAASQ